MKRQYSPSGKVAGAVVVSLLLLGYLNNGKANEAFLSATCPHPFPEAMAYLQQLITSQGFAISRIQQVDRGLHLNGYDSDSYRVIFFGKEKEIRHVQSHYPQLIPYIPLSITIFENNGHTGISALDPASLKRLFNSPAITALLQQWCTSIQHIFASYRHCAFD